MKKASPLLITLIACSCTHHPSNYPFSVTRNASGINPFEVALVILWGSFAVAAYLFYRRGGLSRSRMTAMVARQKAEIDRKLVYAVAILLSLVYGVMLGTTTYYCPQKVADLLVPLTFTFCALIVGLAVYAVETRLRTEDKIRLWRLYVVILCTLTAAGLITTAVL